MSDLTDIIRRLTKLEAAYEQTRTKEVAYTNIGARVYHSANQTIANNTVTTLQFNNETYDTAAFHDNVTNNSRLTIPYAGKYSISASIDFAQHVTGVRLVLFLINGATYIAGNTGPPTTTPNSTVALETKYNFSAGDYVECRVYQDSGGNLNVNRQSDYSPIFMIHRLP